MAVDGEADVIVPPATASTTEYQFFQSLDREMVQNNYERLNQASTKCFDSLKAQNLKQQETLAQQAQSMSDLQARSRKLLRRNHSTMLSSQWSTHTSSLNHHHPQPDSSLIQRNFERVLEISNQNNYQSHTPQLTSGKILQNIAEANPSVILSALGRRGTQPTNTQMAEMALGITALPEKKLTPKPDRQRKA